MDREQFTPSDVGMIALPEPSLRLHRVWYTNRWNPLTMSNCGRKIKSLSEMHIDYLGPTAICQRCFHRTGAAFYLPADRFVLVEFFDQEVLDV